MPSAVIYARISQDTRGEERGVARQLQDCRERAAALGFDVVGEFLDNDVSALRGKTREAYDGMIAAIVRGDARVVVCWQMGRIWRNRRQRAEAIELFATYKVRVVAAKGVDFDFSTATGRSFAAIMGEFDTLESEIKAERVTREAQERAERGELASGGRVFGWSTSTRDQIVSEEAAAIREAARRVLAGDTVSAVVRDWNTAGIPAVRGGQWTRRSLLNVLTHPRIVGRQLYLGRDVGAAKWPPLLDEETFAALRARLATNAQAPGWTNQGKYLLAGLAVCGVCGARLWSHSSRGGSGRVVVAYSCTPKAEGGCRGVSRLIGPAMALDGGRVPTGPLNGADDFVERCVVTRLQRPDILSAIPRGDPGDILAVVAEIRLCREQLDAVAAVFGENPADEIARSQFRMADAKWRDRLSAAKARQAELTRTSALGELAGADDVAGMWVGLPLARRRAVVGELAEVVIRPAGRGPRAGRFEPPYLDVRWRHHL